MSSMRRETEVPSTRLLRSTLARSWTSRKRMTAAVSPRSRRSRGPNSILSYPPVSATTLTMPLLAMLNLVKKEASLVLFQIQAHVISGIIHSLQWTSIYRDCLTWQSALRATIFWEDRAPSREHVALELASSATATTGLDISTTVSLHESCSV